MPFDGIAFDAPNPVEMKVPSLLFGRAPTPRPSFQPVPIPEPVILLTNTLALLRNGSGWTKKRRYRRATNQYCIIGALRSAYRRSDCNWSALCRAKHYLRLAIREYCGRRAVWVVSFNDAKSTTWRDICRVIERATDIAISEAA